VVVEKGQARRGAAGTIAPPDDAPDDDRSDDISVSRDVPVTAIPVAGPPTNGSNGAATDSYPTPRGETRLRYLPGLDGLRAISVLAVLAFHWRPDNSLLRGGFLGVEVFFVISGYLITSLLLAERRHRGGVSLTAFWLRRARRLAPALVAVIVLTGLFVAIFHNSELHANRGDLLFGFWGENWWSIFHHALYNEQGVRQPLQHLWSLAVEEQFYLVWPLVFIAGMATLGRKRMPYAIAALAFVSWFGSMVWLHASSQSAANVQNTLYVNTLSRAYPLLLGALAAFLAAPDRFRGTPAPSAPRALNIMGVVALVLLGVEMVYATLNSHALFYFGLLLTDVLTLAIIVAVVHPASSWNRWLGIRPLRAIGVRSYGIYIWGVVVLEFTRPGIDVHWSSPVLFVVRLVLIAGLVELSYRFLEMPVRRGVIGRAYRGLRSAESTRREAALLGFAVVTGTIVALALPLGVLAAVAQPSKAVNGGQVATGGGDKILKTGGTLPPVPSSTPPSVGTVTTVKPKPGTHPAPASAQFAGYPQVWSKGYIVTAVGDSVMLGANLAAANKPGLLERSLGHIVGPGVWVNAVEGRQASLCSDYLQLLEKDHQLGPIVIVHCGNNGTISNHFVSDVMHIAGPKRHVMFMTDKVERGWEIPNNQLIESQAKNYKNAKVLDWYFFGTHANQNAIFDSEDNGGLKLHLTQPYGAKFYTNLIINTLRQWGWLPNTAAR
jgi:peptidoglycan/LPS O-acetylase OafA/YrhL